MYLLDKTFPSPEENTACDEALLDICEGGLDSEILRFWESPSYFVVLGYSNHADREVHLDACRESCVPVLRRCSGGGTVLQGPGCLNYAVILDTKTRPDIQTVTRANETVMQTLRRALQPLAPADLEVQGHTDLTIRDMKFSGNAQRRRKRFILFHGTVLYRFDLIQIERFLKFPSKQPGYRKDRTHQNFVGNFPAAASDIRNCLRSTLEANRDFAEDLGTPLNQLVESKYSVETWNLR